MTYVKKLRDTFAQQAMSAILADPQRWTIVYPMTKCDTVEKYVARIAYKIADIMLRERTRR